jgi:hypothetical protein
MPRNFTPSVKINGRTIIDSTAPKRIILFEGCVEYIFLETDPTTGSAGYVLELWSCEDPVVVARAKTFPTARAALGALLDSRGARFS